ncbi:MAG: hypothetical protein ACXWAT_00675 [Methylobacter sp.]
MKRSDLFRRYAEVIDMCEGTNVRPLLCVRVSGENVSTEPCFNGNAAAYTFALAIVEDKPVFAGDVLYDEFGPIQIIDRDNGNNVTCRSTDPKSRDFYIGAHELKAYSWKKPDPFAELLQAKAEGKRVVFFCFGEWIDTNGIDTVNFKPESYRVVEHDESHKFTYLAPRRITCSELTINLKKDGITGKITAEVIDD